jgi:hypothetical protein
VHSKVSFGRSGVCLRLGRRPDGSYRLRLAESGTAAFRTGIVESCHWLRLVAASRFRPFRFLDPAGVCELQDSRRGEPELPHVATQDEFAALVSTPSRQNQSMQFSRSAALAPIQ